MSQESFVAQSLLVVLKLAVWIAQSNGMVDIVAWLFDQEFLDGCNWQCAVRVYREETLKANQQW